jgi:hypothetical protein
MVQLEMKGKKTGWGFGPFSCKFFLVVIALVNWNFFSN